MEDDRLKQWKDIERIKATLSYNVISSSGEHYFDSVAQLIAVICKTPLAFVSFIDANDQWYVA